ncbi:MAG: hypothetical protein ACE5KO_01920 [Candidatus Bathyarchaeia archaeon]
MDLPKAIQSLQKAVSELADARSVLQREGIGHASTQIWRASAETEYALFIFGLTFVEKPKVNLGRNSQRKNFDPIDAISRAYASLREALEINKQGGDGAKLYAAVYVARSHLVALQERLELGRI